MVAWRPLSRAHESGPPPSWRSTTALTNAAQRGRRGGCVSIPITSDRGRQQLGARLARWKASLPGGKFGAASSGGRIVRREERALRLFVDHFLEIMILFDCVRTRRTRAARPPSQRSASDADTERADRPRLSLRERH